MVAHTFNPRMQRQAGLWDLDQLALSGVPGQPVLYNDIQSQKNVFCSLFKYPVMVVYAWFIYKVTPWVPCSHQNTNEHVHSLDCLLRLYTARCHFVMTCYNFLAAHNCSDWYLKLILISSVNCPSDKLGRRDGGGSTLRLLPGLLQVEQDLATLEPVRQSKRPGYQSGNWAVERESYWVWGSEDPLILHCHSFLSAELVRNDFILG